MLVNFEVTLNVLIKEIYPSCTILSHAFQMNINIFTNPNTVLSILHNRALCQCYYASEVHIGTIKIKGALCHGYCAIHRNYHNWIAKLTVYMKVTVQMASYDQKCVGDC